MNNLIQQHLLNYLKNVSYLDLNLVVQLNFNFKLVKLF